MPSSVRMIRLGEQIREEIAQMILRQQIKDPRVSTFLSVNRVDVSGDLSYAKVYISSFMSDEETERGVEGLQSAAGFIQTRLSKKLTVRQFPRITFVRDESIKEGIEMVWKLSELEKAEAEAAEAREKASVRQDSDGESLSRS